jgi:type I restriction enzyme M protein
MQAEKQFHSGRLGQSTRTLSKVRWVLRDDFGNLLLIWTTSHKLGRADKTNWLSKSLCIWRNWFWFRKYRQWCSGRCLRISGTVCQWRRESRWILYPQQVSSVLAQIVTAGKDQLKSVYDPTCGSGSLLRVVAKEVKNVSAFTVRRWTYHATCRMNMIMHDVHYKRFDIKNEDTLERPLHLDMRFDHCG